jgi:pyruvate/2-oxoglutarate/acetoin dehydrogenase E1 component
MAKRGDPLMARLNMVQAINQALGQIMAEDARVVLLGEDVGKNGGVFRVTEGLYDRFGPDRVMDTPLAESGIVGCAIGMAVAGLRPVAEIQFMGFLYPALNQIFSHAGRLRQRSGGVFQVPLVVRIPYGGGIRAPEQHADSAEAHLVHTPGIKVVVPSSPRDAKGLLLAAIQDPDPVMFLEPIRCYRAARQEVPEELYAVPLSQAARLREGTDCTLIAWGAMVPLALEVAEGLAREGISLEVIDLRTLSPMDEDTLAASVQKTGRAVIVHEAPLTAGLGAEVVARIVERAFWWLKAPVARVAGFDVPYPPYAWEDWYLPSVERVTQAVRRALED